MAALMVWRRCSFSLERMTYTTPISSVLETRRQAQVSQSRCMCGTGFNITTRYCRRRKGAKHAASSRGQSNSMPLDANLEPQPERIALPLGKMRLLKCLRGFAEGHARQARFEEEGRCDAEHGTQSTR